MGSIMVTNDLFLNLVKCDIEGDKIVVGGKEFVVESLEELDGYKATIYTAFGALLVGLILMIAFVGKGVFDDIAQGNKIFEGYSEFAIVFIAAALYLFAIFVVYKRLKYCGRWKINGFKYVYIEESDMPDIYEKLKRLESIKKIR